MLKAKIKGRVLAIFWILQGHSQTDHVMPISRILVIIYHVTLCNLSVP